MLYMTLKWSLVSVSKQRRVLYFSASSSAFYCHFSFLFCSVVKCWLLILLCCCRHGLLNSYFYMFFSTFFLQHLFVSAPTALLSWVIKITLYSQSFVVVVLNNFAFDCEFKQTAMKKFKKT